MVLVGSLGAAMGLYVYYYQDEASDLDIPGLNIDDVNLFDRDEFVFFDWGIYASFAAITSGIFTVILSGVEISVNRNKSY